jgi:hypothetical protein
MTHAAMTAPGKHAKRDIDSRTDRSVLSRSLGLYDIVRVANDDAIIGPQG